MIRGYDDHLKELRNFAWISVAKLPDGTTMFSALPLRCDDEIEDGGSVMTDQQIYEEGKLIRLPNTNYNG